MAGPILNVGAGFFILAFIWAAALMICLVFARSPTKTSNLGPLAIAIAGVITLILIVIPREDQFPSETEKSVKYDYSIVYRSSLIAAMALFVVIGLVCYMMHAMQPLQAKPLRKLMRS